MWQALRSLVLKITSKDPLKISAHLRLRFLEVLCRGSNIDIQKHPKAVDFYLWHLQTQLETFHSLFKHMIPQHTSNTECLDQFFEIYLMLWEHSLNEPYFSIDTTVKALKNDQNINLCSTVHVMWEPNMDQQLLFFMFGPLTMLYKAKIDQFSADSFKIEDKNKENLYRYDAFTKNSYQGSGDPTVTSRQKFGTLLRNHGAMPFYIKNSDIEYYLFEDLEPRLKNPSELNSEEYNAYFLQAYCGMKFAWVDLLDAHLEFDRSNNTLYIFRFPSFCMLNIPTIDGDEVMGVLRNCVPLPQYQYTWRTISDLEGYMKEIILSTHLLFGQSKRSRSMFNSKNAFPNTPRSYHDPLLQRLCTKDWDLPRWPGKPKSIYYNLEEDFPILQGRLNILKQRIDNAHSKGLGPLWEHKKYSIGCYSLWVAIFGNLFSVFVIVLAAVSMVQFHYLMAENTGIRDN